MKLSGLIVLVSVLSAFAYPTTAHWVYSLQDDAWLTNGRDGHGCVLFLKGRFWADFFIVQCPI